MNFYVKKRRTPVLQIISMIDILIILLIFLTVTTTFKDSHAALNITLPVSREMSLGPAPENRQRVSVTAEGKILLMDAEVGEEEFADALVKLKAERPGLKLELHVDENVPFKTLIKLWDGLARAGFKTSDAPTRVLRPG